VHLDQGSIGIVRTGDPRFEQQSIAHCDPFRGSTA
jgi:hypothetical protein